MNVWNDTPCKNGGKTFFFLCCEELSVLKVWTSIVSADLRGYDVTIKYCQSVPMKSHLQPNVPLTTPKVVQFRFTIHFFFSEQPFYGNYSTLDSHTNTNFSLGCLLVKMASKTVTRSVYLTTVEGLVRGNPRDEKKVSITKAGLLREWKNTENV